MNDNSIKLQIGTGRNRTGQYPYLIVVYDDPSDVDRSNRELIGLERDLLDKTSPLAEKLKRRPYEVTQTSVVDGDQMDHLGVSFRTEDDARAFVKLLSFDHEITSADNRITVPNALRSITKDIHAIKSR